MGCMHGMMMTMTMKEEEEVKKWVYGLWLESNQVKEWWLTNDNNDDEEEDEKLNDPGP